MGDFEDLPAMEPTYELIMPMVVTTDSGGPLDSHAFAAGIRFNQLWQRLEQGHPDVMSSYEYPELIPQLELLAMHFGYVLEHEPWEGGDEGEWELVRFCLPSFTTLEGGGER